MRRIFLMVLGMLSLGLNSQKTEISFETNGLDSLIVNNPFHNFIGEWTLKNDSWTHNWGGATETIKIPNHHTISTQINTANSLFSIIDGPQPNGHIFWSYNPVTKAVHHLSSFGALRVGVGEGGISKNGDVTLKISFEGEPKNTYRIYTYRWVTPDEYHMKSVQYDTSDTPTGLFYEGTFVRLPVVQNAELRAKLETILSTLDNTDISLESQLEVYADDVVHMAPGSEWNIGKEALGNYLREQRKYGRADMKHELLEMEVHGGSVIMRGQVRGSFYPSDGAPPVVFRTKNLFVLETTGGALKIKKVIYNSSPLD